MKYAIYSDVDGTIYGHQGDKFIHPHNIEAIEKARRLGVEFVIATGNGPFEVMKTLCARLGASYLVSSNGSAIYDFNKQDFIFTSHIPAEKVKTLIEVAMQLDVFASGWDERDFFAVKEKLDDDTLGLYGRVMLGKNKNIRHLGEIDGPILKFEVYDEPHKIDKFIEKTSDLNLQMARMKPGHVEITHYGVSKGEAIKLLNELLGVEKDNFMTIGDSANDHSMLAITPYSYAMANAGDKTKAIAKLHTSSAEQGGVGEAIDDFLYRKKIDL